MADAACQMMSQPLLLRLAGVGGGYPTPPGDRDDLLTAFLLAAAALGVIVGVVLLFLHAIGAL